MLRPGGRCALSTFLVEYGDETTKRSWTEWDGSFMRFPLTPRKMVGQTTQALSRWFGSEPEVVGGNWRGYAVREIPAHSAGTQDLVVFTKSAADAAAHR